MSTSTVTCQVWRLEKDEPSTNEYKQYTAIYLPGRQFQIAGVAYFGYSRIGAKWQWSVKEGGDSAGHVASQLNSKRRNGYVDVWQADVDVPTDWLTGLDSPATTVKAHTTVLQDLIETAYRHGDSRVSAQTSVEDGSPRSVLADVVDQARAVVSKLTTSPDEALADYSALVGQVDAARSDWDVVDGYMEALRAMLMAKSEEAFV